MKKIHSSSNEKYKRISNTVHALNSCAWKKSVFVICIITIPIINFFVFWLYANINGILMAFKNIEAGVEYYTFDNIKKSFIELFTLKGNIGLSFKNTLIFFVVSVIMFPVGLFWAYVFYKKVKFYNFFRLMFFIPSILSSAVIAGIVKFMINADGPIGALWAELSSTGVTPNFLKQEEYAFKTVIIYHYWVGMAGSLLLLCGAFAKIPEEVIESISLDGCGWWREMWQICIPLIWPTLSTIIILTLTSIFMDGAPVLLMTGGGGNSSTISYWMYDQIKLKGATYEPSAFGLILTILTMLIILPARKILNNIYADVEV